MSEELSHRAEFEHLEPTRRSALVIHCKLSPYAGAEFLGLSTCKILQEMGFHVSILSDVFEPSRAEEIYGMGDVLGRCTHIRLPEPTLHPPFRLDYLTRILYVIRLARFSRVLNQKDFQLILSTQSSIFSFPGKRLYHFVYELNDLFRYPMPLIVPPYSRPKPFKSVYFYLLRALYARLAPRPSPTWFFVAGPNLNHQFRSMGHQNSSLFFPPSRVFEPKIPKKNQIIQVSRISPEKRIEMLFELARRLPQYSFVLAGKNPSAQRLLHPGYSDKLLSKVPASLDYIETPIVKNPELLEESKVYLQTSEEWGVLLTLIEAMSAGCIPVVPSVGSGAEIVKLAGVGYIYENLDDATEKIRLAMEGETRWSPLEISERAKQFGPGAFENMIRKICSEDTRNPPT